MWTGPAADVSGDDIRRYGLLLCRNPTSSAILQLCLTPYIYKLLLSAMYRTRGDDGLENRFLVGPPGTPLWQRRISTFVFFRRRLLVRAALYVRKSGPLHLRSTAMNDIQSQLRDFAIANYGLFATDTFLRQFEESYNERIGHDVKARLADLLAASELFSPRSCLALYPLCPLWWRVIFARRRSFFFNPARSAKMIRALGRLQSRPKRSLR